jgi:hypothetical protein
VTAPESTAQVFWRLVKQGVSSGDIGRDPDYQAAFDREAATHRVGCACFMHTRAPGREVQS